MAFSGSQRGNFHEFTIRNTCSPLFIEQIHLIFQMRNTHYNHLRGCSNCSNRNTLTGKVWSPDPKSGEDQPTITYIR
jgi:hypothetical protein